MKISCTFIQSMNRNLQDKKFFILLNEFSLQGKVQLFFKSCPKIYPVFSQETFFWTKTKVQKKVIQKVVQKVVQKLYPCSHKNQP